MIDRILRSGSGVAMVMIAACRYQPTPVQLQGAPRDIAAIAGQWEGEYASSVTGRTGSITFAVQPGKDTAFGDVLMVPQYGNPITAADVESQAHVLHAAQPSLLRITFVRVRSGYVEGALEPYIAPDCRCRVTTVFRGMLSGGSIGGDYVTTGEMGLRQTGTWSVKRRP